MAPGGRGDDTGLVFFDPLECFAADEALVEVRVKFCGHTVGFGAKGLEGVDDGCRVYGGKAVDLGVPRGHIDKEQGILVPAKR